MFTVYQAPGPLASGPECAQLPGGQTGLTRQSEWSQGPSWTDSGSAELCPQAPAPPVPWAAPGDTPPCHCAGSAVPQVITIFSLVEVVLQAEAAALKYSAILKQPGTEGLKESDKDNQRGD